MKRTSFSCGSILVLGCAGLLMPGCSDSKTQVVDLPPPEVTVSKPLHQEVIDYYEFTGRTEASKTVDVRAQISGKIVKIHFKDGEEVAKNKLLIEIDDREYKAELGKAKADVARLKVTSKKATSSAERATDLRGKGAISAEEYEQAIANRDDLLAQLAAADAIRDRSQTNFDYCKIRADIAGRVSRALMVEGNLVTGGGMGTLLTNIVGINPMYVYFDVDQKTILEHLKNVREKKVKSANGTQPALDLGLADTKDFPFHGVVDFVDNKVDPSTGTVSVRGSFKNPKSPDGSRVLAAGLFARVRLPRTTPYQALLVVDRAIGSDQGNKYVFVVAEGDKVEYRPVTTGTLHKGLRVIEKGLARGERVIVNGIQRVRPGIKVQPELVAMPVPTRPDKAKTPLANGNVSSKKASSNEK